MTCEEVQASFVFYLDDEVTPSERTLIEQHLAGCETCRRELAALSAARASTNWALQRLAEPAVPSSLAWDRLQMRLAKSAPSSPAKHSVWRPRLAQGTGHTLIDILKGIQPMRKRILIPALAAMLAIALVAAVLLRNVAPVSAQQVLDRAQAQLAAAQTPGISHLRVEVYQNLQALSLGQADTRRTIESYSDSQTGYFRSVTTDNASGRVTDANAYDGSYVYTHRFPDQAVVTATNEVASPITVYRSPQSGHKIAGASSLSTVPMSAEEAFKVMRNNPSTTVSEATWGDGRAVYVLRSEQPVKMISGTLTLTPIGVSELYFDAQTYEMLQSSTATSRDGQEIMLSSTRILVNETLPAGSPVAWDLSDVQGITLVDDPQGEQGDYLPEVITAQELASHTQTAYLLKTVPEGFTLEISAPPHQPADQTFLYVITYRNAAGDYFVFSPTNGEVNLTIPVSGTYQTKAGLTLSFLDEQTESGQTVVTSAYIGTPKGNSYFLNSTLPLERIKALAEDLVPVK
jgi:hypothetical protein